MTTGFFARFPRFNFRTTLDIALLFLILLAPAIKTCAEGFQSRLSVEIFQPEALYEKGFLSLFSSPQNTITVTTTAQTGAGCTLANAIHAANTNAPVGGCAAGSVNGTDTIILPAGTYTLTAVDNTENIFGTSNGLPIVNSPIIIQGAGADSTIIERSAAAGTPEFRFIQFGASGDLTVNGVTFKNGRTTPFGAGAILPFNTLTVNNCRFENNSTGNGGAGGGAIGSSFGYNLIVNNSTFTGNTSGYGGGAIGAASSLTITNSTFTNNSATAFGGAVSMANASTAVITGSTFSGNTITGDGAGGAINGYTVNVSNTNFNQNAAPYNSSNANGGAIYARFITVDKSVFTNNTAGAYGGAIGNVPTAGAFVTITNSTFSGNTAQHGGGIHGANTTVDNSTISGNFARENGGGILFGGSNSVLNINNATITNNRADSDNNGSGRGGGLLHSYSFAPSTSKYIRNSIIAGNINNAAPDCADEYGAAMQSQGYNLIGNNTGCNFTAAAGDIVGTAAQPVNPNLGALANNGSGTQTHALLPNSPAIDAANPNTPDGTGNNCLPNDQRGGVRPGDGDDNGTPRCDIGAFEIITPIPTSLAFTVQPSNTTAGQTIAPAVQVAVLDQFGAVYTGATNSITIALGNNPGGNGILSGTLTRSAAGGVATFDDLSLTRAANGYTLTASATSVTSAASNSFNISAGNPAQLVFTVQPVETEALATMPPVSVAVTDQFGNTVTGATNAVTLSLNDTSDRLRGTLTRNAVGGIAVFNDLSFTQPANGYQIQANADGLAQAVSDPFNITRPILVVTKTADTNDGACNADCSLREAMTIANQFPGTDTINFNISGTPPFDLTQTTSNLPVINSPVVIDGTTQPGYAGSPVVRINPYSEGFRIIGGNSTIRGLNINMDGVLMGITILSDNNTIQGNFIVSESGVQSNQITIGILIAEFQTSGNLIGGDSPEERNVISGTGYGISIIHARDNRISGNFIGTDATGMTAQPNHRGIFALGAENNIIGGLTAGERNVISGNSEYGVYIQGGSANLQGNYIGRNAGNTGNIPNGQGIHLRGTHTVGGAEAGAGNVIAGNNSYGIRVHPGTSTRENIIRGNSIYDNAHLGISLTENYDSTDLPTPNDPGDADSGPNFLQNYPVLTSAHLSGGNLNLQGSLNSEKNSTFVIEFFSNTACDASGYGEGETLIGTTTVTTDVYNGIADFSVALPPVADGSFITATATNYSYAGITAKGTSEFSQCKQAFSDYFRISGRLTNSGNEPLAQDHVLIQVTGTRNLSTTANTNGDWAYSFDNLPDGVYTVTPSSSFYDFIPASRTYTNPVGDQINQDFDRVRSRYRVTGVVKTDCNGAAQALGQVELTVSGGVNQSGQTDASGQVIFALPLSGNYVLTPSFGNYTFDPPSVTLPNPLTADVTVEFAAEAPLPLCSKFATHEGYTIKSMNADGSAFAELSSPAIVSADPDLSRDGSRLAFVESGQIYVADFDGSSKVQLTTGNVEKHFPRLSPDKTKIVYQSRTGGTPRLNLIDLQNNTITPINTSPQSGDSDLEPSWSPDGAKIVFHRIHRPAGGNFTHNIFSINADGTNLTQLTNFSANGNDKYAYPDWSPDGTKIIFVRHLGLTRSIMMMNADGTNLTPAYSSTDSIAALSHPRFSPDGTKIAFIEPYSTGNSFYRRLVVVNADGSGRIELREGLFGSLSWAAQYQVPTATGTNVPVESGGVSLNFAGVSGAGQTTVNPIPSFSAGNVPGGFVISGVAYEITTTAAYSAPVTVCFTVPATIGQTQTQFNLLKLMHNENGSLVDRTTSRDFPTRQICGSVKSLSPFALAEQVDVTKPQISGLVLDSNGNPMSGVRVFLTGAETKETETDTDGVFRFVNLTEGANYNVQPKQLGYIFDSYSQDFTGLAGEQTVVFTGTAGSFDISGRVTDGNGNGIGNVTLQLNDGTFGETTTDANGDYTFAGLPADGSYTVRPFNIGSFSPSEAVINPLLGNVGNVNFSQLAPTAATVSVGGRALTADGRGISGARVTLTEADGTVRSVSTGTFGYYRFTGVQTGQNVIVSVSAKRFQFNQSSQVVNLSDAIENLDFVAEPF